VSDRASDTANAHIISLTFINRRIKQIQSVTFRSPMYYYHSSVVPVKQKKTDYTKHHTLNMSAFIRDSQIRLSCNVLHGWKVNSMHAKPLAAYTYLSSIVSELYDALRCLSQRVSPKIAIFTTFWFPQGMPLGQSR